MFLLRCSSVKINFTAPFSRTNPFNLDSRVPKDRREKLSISSVILCKFLLTQSALCFQGEPGFQGISGPRGPPGQGLQGDKVTMNMNMKYE